MTQSQQLITIALVALATMATRFLAFIVFPKSKNTPKFVLYIGRALPPAVFAMLVVYCFKDTAVLTYPYAIPEIISFSVVASLHLWKRNVLLSIAAGTLCYLILLNFVFV